MPFAETPFTSTILPIPVTRLGAHPNVVMAVLAGRAGPITVEHAGVSVTGDVLLVRPGIVHSVRLGRRGADVVYLNGLTFPFEAPLAVALKGNLEQLARRSIGGDPCATEELRERLAFATDPLPAKVAEIVRAMQADPMRRVSQDELVRCLGMERTRALRCFKAATGLTFRRFKLWSALQHAAAENGRARAGADGSDGCRFRRYRPSFARIQQHVRAVTQRGDRGARRPGTGMTVTVH